MLKNKIIEAAKRCSIENVARHERTIVELEKQIADEPSYLARILELVKSIPDELYHCIASVGSVSIHLENTSSFDDMKAQLRGFQKVFGNYKVSRYYPFGNSLAIVHEFFNVELNSIRLETVNVVSYVPDVEESLKRISDGKCHLTTNIHTTRDVVCGL